MQAQTTPPVSPATPLRAVLIWIVAGLSGLVALVLLLAVSVGIWLATPSGRDFALARLREAVPGLALAGADGSLFDLRLGRVTLADDQGVWLTVDQARLTWNPWALLTGTVKVIDLGAAAVTVDREPLPTPDQPDDKAGPIRLPVAVTVEALALDRVTLGADLLGGSPAVLKLSGRAQLPAGALGGAGALDVARIDDRPGTLTLSADYRPGRRLTLSAEALEQGNGLLAELLDIPGRPPVTLTLKGDGPLTDWTGTATAKAGDAADAKAEFRIRPVDGKLTFGLDLSGNVQALVPTTIRPLVGPDLRVGAGGLIDPGVQLALDGVSVQMAAGRLVGGGGYDLKTRAVNVGAWVEVPDSTLLLPLTAPARFTAARGSLTLTGTPDAPQLVADLTADNPALADLAAKSLGLKLTAKAANGLRAIDSKADIALDGTIGPLADLTGPRATLSAQALVTPAGGRIALSDATLTGNGIQAGAKGDLTGWGRDGQLALTLAARDLAPLSGLAGRPLRGGVAVEGDLRLAAGVPSLALKGRVDGLGTGIPAADALLTGRTDLTADLSLGSPVVVNRLTLSGPHLHLSGQGRFGAGVLAADATLDIPDLSPLTPALGSEMAGSVKVQVRSTAADTLVMEATGADLVLDGLHLKDSRIDAQFAGLPAAPRGRVTLAASLNGQRIGVTSSLSMAGSKLSVPDLEAVIGLNRFNGSIAWDRATGLATGRLDGTVPDLGILAFIVGDEVWGNGRVGIDLIADKGRQSADVQADFKEIWRRWHGQKIAQVGLTARLDGKGKLPSWEAGFTLTGVDFGTLDLDSVKGGISGPLSAAAIRFDLSGKRGQAPLRLSLAGQLSAGTADGVTRLGLARLTGTYADTDFRLDRPVGLSYGDGVMGVDNLALLAGEARIDLSADLSRQGLGGQLTLARVPLNWVRMIEPTLTLYGHLDGTATLSGSVADPRAGLSLKLSDFAFAPPAPKGPSPLTAVLNGQWRGGRVGLDLRVDSAGDGVGLVARADLPLEMQGSATNIVLPEDKPVSGRLEGNLALRRLNDLLATSGDRLSGQMVLDLTLGGTLAHRDLTGTVTLDKARYENQRWGTQVTDIQAVLTGDPHGLAIQRFEGKTPGGGTVTLEGTLGFRPELGDRQVDLRLRATKAKLANIDMVEAVAGADIAVTGKPDDVTLAGRIDVANAHIRIPDKLPPTVVELKVVEINQPRRSPPPGAVSSADPKTQPQEPDVLVVRFNIDVEAPNQIYVAGRGLDAELKASLKLRGTDALPLLSGNVSLVKGEMGVLGQTFTLSRANVTFLGDGTFDPALDVEARTQRGDLTAIVDITGRPSKPAVKLSSEPVYPEDEVLARLLFNRGAGQLSALEAVQLAQSAAQLSGLFGGGPGFVDNIKRSLGVDRLEFRGSEDGTGAGTVAAGRYIGDNIYIGVEQELGTGQSKATVEYGITQHIKARGEVGTESKVGVQFEWDY